MTREGENAALRRYLVGMHRATAFDFVVVFAWAALVVAWALWWENALTFYFWLATGILVVPAKVRIYMPLFTPRSGSSTDRGRSDG